VTGPSRPAGATAPRASCHRREVSGGAARSSPGQFRAARPGALKRLIENPGNSDRHHTTEGSDRAGDNQA
jgi:hypothetical protein